MTLFPLHTSRNKGTSLSRDVCEIIKTRNLATTSSSFAEVLRLFNPNLERLWRFDPSKPDTNCSGLVGSTSSHVVPRCDHGAKGAKANPLGLAALRAVYKPDRAADASHRQPHQPHQTLSHQWYFANAKVVECRACM